MMRKWLAALAVLILPMYAGGQEAPESATGLQQNVIFSAYSPLSGSAEVARRTLSPLAEVPIARVSAQLRPQAVDLAQERFSLYVPSQAPPQGYALLVFIAPWEDAHLPQGWAHVLDEHGMIFVSAAKSGNEENVLDRRIPLALLGAYNVMQRYRIDPDRVYTGGFSGGARVAMRTALAYPDLFHGALLDAGSDAIGTGAALLPAKDLFAKFQSSASLVYVTGSEDSWNIQHDMLSRDSMSAWCVFGTHVKTMFQVSHDVATSNALNDALSLLDQRAPIGPGKLSSCRARIARELAADIQHVADLIEHNKAHEAGRALSKLDVRYGGLAAPESVQLQQRIGSGH